MLKDFIMYLIFGNHCKYCCEIINFGENLCDDCKNDLPRITGEKCKYCGAGKDRCNCRKAKKGYDGICAPFYYEKGIEKAIRKYKFQDKPYISRVLAEDMAESVKTEFDTVKFDFIDFVPFSKIQKRKRNYNPAGEIAKELSKLIDVPVKNVLIKTFETKTQHTTKGVYRKGNVAGVYDITENVDIKGKTVLLVDDIKTSGSTLAECVKVLKIAGADKVYCAVAAIVADEKTDPEN